MEIGQIIAALRHNKIAAMLIALQIALTLAIVCNSLSIIQQRLSRMQQATGIEESNIFVFDNQWVGDQADLGARIQGDLRVLRSLPGVIDAVATEAYPLRGGGQNGWLTLKPDQKPPVTWAGYYMFDEHALAAFGGRLVGGRWFTAEEIGSMAPGKLYVPQTVVVTSALAKAMYPSGDALGKQIYYVNFPMRIVGVVDKFQAAITPLSWGEQFVEHSVLAPVQMISNKLSFVVRTRPGQRDAVMRAVPQQLFAVSRARIIDNMHTFTETRAQAYHGARALSLILGTVSVLLLTVTALGVVGLTSYWVAQRRRAIGVRRALGACRTDILRYFHTENLLIVGVGVVFGVALGLTVNIWLAESLQLARMSPEFILLGAAIVFALSQVAVVWPALRAASIPPAIAARAA